eukprot:TRINITY_DN10394_c0_g1_i4.p1 TRINITY_DN10394_c0_g1~~TRINITY_DN10394_c0_g1_i4.p1  ORF type:complete len:325 (-),score=72.68 TRINITY_DN10394_c0_g1_i4:39-1013(-)
MCIRDRYKAMQAAQAEKAAEQEKKRGFDLNFLSSADRQPLLGMSDSNVGNSRATEESKKKVNKRLPKVTLDHVKEIGYEINLRFKLERINYADAESKLFTDEAKRKGVISIREMKDVLKGNPFRIRDEDKLLLVSRYLVEDNQEDYVMLDEEKTLEIGIVKSVFKNLLGNYTILDEHSEDALFQEITTVLQKYRLNLIETFNQKPEAKLGYVKPRDIESAFRELDIVISTRQLEYMYMRLFELSDDLNKLDCFKLFEIFNPEEQNAKKSQHQTHNNTANSHNNSLSNNTVNLNKNDSSVKKSTWKDFYQFQGRQMVCLFLISYN